jgi:hypothetical protein
MSTLAATAERLRLVKTAEKRFLALWASECIFSQERPLDAFATDLRATAHSCDATIAGGRLILFPPSELDDLDNRAH